MPYSKCARMRPAEGGMGAQRRRETLEVTGGGRGGQAKDATGVMPQDAIGASARRPGWAGSALDLCRALLVCQAALAGWAGVHE